ncbi:MAG: hypothetical protein A2Y76_13360 [Planctomycetes bacterium RBG_13_60_9]|nr:MAG: hypothetical protein A2Y76_13360 [Planctomycetes bacterium RBG_13_60_9]
MDQKTFCRSEERLCSPWPVWFGEDTTQAGFLGLIVDISSGGLAFTCPPDRCRFREGQKLTVRFDVPQFGRVDDPEAMVGVIRTGWLRSVVTRGRTCRIGLQFDQPLSLKPAEEAILVDLCHTAAPP